MSENGRRTSFGVPRRRRARRQYLHVAIDDHSRLAHCEILHSERKAECAAFLRRAVAWYASQGIAIERVLSDNAKAYHSHLWRDTCAELGVARRHTRPYSPWTNGKAEALIKTLLRVGVPVRVLDEHSPQQGAARLPQVVQPTKTPRLARSPTSDQPRLTRLWSVHLGVPRRSTTTLTGVRRASPRVSAGRRRGGRRPRRSRRVAARRPRSEVRSTT